MDYINQHSRPFNYATICLDEIIPEKNLHMSSPIYGTERAWMAKYNPLHKLRGCPVNCTNDTGIIAIKIDHIFTNFKLERISIWNTMIPIRINHRDYKKVLLFPKFRYIIT